MFSEFKQTMQQVFAMLLEQSQRQLYMTDVDREKLWQTYLDSLPEMHRQEHTCHACRSFIKHYGGLVFITNGEVKTIWDFPGEGIFEDTPDAMAKLVREARIIDVFETDTSKLGTDKNFVQDKNLNIVATWEHFFINLPQTMVHRGGDSLDAVRGKARDNRNVFKRGLDEITLEAIDTVLDLVAQNSLYRGVESKGAVTQFRELKARYSRIADENKDVWAWGMASQFGGGVAQMRNTAMGTLLINLSEGMDVDVAVDKFEMIMAPANYKRPNAIITPKMVEQAEKTIMELGYGASLGRRFADVDDINVTNTLFVDRSLTKKTGVLADLKESVLVNPRMLTRVEEIDVNKFMVDVLPRCTKMEVLFENRQVRNLVSLIAPVDPKAPSIFKWPNGFSWSYKDAVADSIKEKVKAAGGKTEGELRVSLSWHNGDDLDLHIVELGRTEIYYAHKKSVLTNGELDVDMNARGIDSIEPIENIIYPSATSMKEGTYKVIVHQFNRRQTIDTGFTVEIECRGQRFTFDCSEAMPQGKIKEVAEFRWSRRDGMTIVTSMEHSEKVTSKKVWGIDTSKFHPVSMVLPSPNFWLGTPGAAGNQHVLFIIDQAHNDEVARGFFNEFLKPELETHKRVFEALGSRTKVAPADKQVSGLGFSATQHDELIVRVEGAITRTLKIKF